MDELRAMAQRNAEVAEGRLSDAERAAKVDAINIQKRKDAFQRVILDALRATKVAVQSMGGQADFRENNYMGARMDGSLEIRVLNSAGLQSYASVTVELLPEGDDIDINAAYYVPKSNQEAVHQNWSTRHALSSSSMEDVMPRLRMLLAILMT